VRAEKMPSLILGQMREDVLEHQRHFFLGHRVLGHAADGTHSTSKI
jgi:hypothetical protein